MPRAWYNDYAEPAFVGNARVDWGFRFPLWGWDSVMFKYTDGAAEIFRCRSDPSDSTRGLRDDNGNYPNTGVTPANPGPTPQELKTDDLASSCRWNASDQQIVLTDMLDKQPRNSVDPALHGMKSWDTDPNGGEAFGRLKTTARDQTRNRRTFASARIRPYPPVSARILLRPKLPAKSAPHPPSSAGAASARDHMPSLIPNQPASLIRRR